MLPKVTTLSHSLSSAFLCPAPPSSSKPLVASLLSTPTITTLACLSPTAGPQSSLCYGPSLSKGHQPLQSQPQLPDEQRSNSYGDELFNEETFARVFEIAALRVPSETCFALESRLRGHLLNWPRIRNIARVSGDEIEDDFKKFHEHQSGPNCDDDNSVQLASLSRRVYGKAEGDGEPLSPILYRDKLVKSFNSTGYVNFRSLAKLSRPKRRKKKEGLKERGKTQKKGIRRNESSLVEVVDEQSEEEDLSGLLGNDFKGRRWRGSTRLLLLDERYCNRSMEQMPEAIKAVCNEDGARGVTSTFELVQCKLTLFYSYWQLNEILEALLPKGILIPSAFETVGHIIHLNLRDEHLPYKRLIARVVLDKNRPKIQTVVNKIDSIQNEYRTMELDVLAGNHSLVTTVVENGLRFLVDLAKVYWNSRLATERQRLLDAFKQNDVVCDVFAGVGPITISAAKKAKFVYANDLNPHAVEYLERNSVLNKLERKIEVFNMEGRRFINAVFTSQRTRPVTQVVMNLPNDAAEYLDAFWGIFREMPKEKTLVFPRIHVYGFSKAQDPEFDFHERIRIALSEVAFEVEIRKVRLVAPGKWMLCASFMLPESVAFAKKQISSSLI